MAVDDPDKIDMISPTPDGKGMQLFITDHLPWDNVPLHLAALQTKLNRYLAYIQSEDFVARFPDAQEKPAHIEVCFASDPSAEGEQFLNRAREMIGRAGWSLSWQVIPSPLD